MARKNENDLERYDWSKAERGKYVEKAKRSFETLLIDKKVVTTLGGATAVAGILRALADALDESGRVKKRAAKKTSRAA